MSKRVRNAIFLSVVALCALFRCSIAPFQTAGGSSDTEISKTFVGSVVDINGKAVSNATVWLNPVDSTVNVQPAEPGPAPKPPNGSEPLTTTTDSAGTFRISNVKTGNYALEINSGDSIAILMHCSMDSGDTVKKLPLDTLKPMVTITGTIVPDGSQNTVVIVDGLVRHVQIDSFGRFQIKVPYGEHKIRFFSRDHARRGNVYVPYMTPGTVQEIGYIDPNDSVPAPPCCTDSVCDASALRLMLDDCDMDSVSVDSVATFRNGRITELHLRRIGLRTLSVEIVRLTHLEVLDVGENQLHSPLTMLSQCDSLKVLRIDGNHLPFITYDFGALCGLVELDLSNNELSSLPISIVSLTPSILKLDNNRLLEISGPAAAWADTYEPSWRQTQRSGGFPPFKEFDPVNR